MKLNIEVGFYLPISVEEKGFLKYRSIVEADDSFSHSEIERQAYALRIADEELRKAVQRTNDRLKNEGLGKNAFYTKKLDNVDEFGNVIATGEGWTAHSSNLLQHDALAEKGHEATLGAGSSNDID